MTLAPTDVRLDVTPLSGTIGAEIRGVDSAPPRRRTVAAIRGVWLERKVVFFPGQHLTPDRAPRVRRALRRADRGPSGDPRHRRATPRSSRSTTRRPASSTPAVRRRQHRASAGSTGTPTSPSSSGRRSARSCDAVVIPPAGGDTLFSDQQARLRGAEPEPLQAFLAHPHRRPRRRRPSSSGILDSASARASGRASVHRARAGRAPRRAHPPRDRRRGRCSSTPASPRTSRSSTGRRERRAARRSSTPTRSQPEFTVRYHWHDGDIGFWDNRATQHAVVGDFGDQHRVIQRVTLRGDRAGLT